ncbi:hypothetical protein CLIB1423_08S01266 [[Candida] railenensis]|uniref:Uncharacterized protein n=1 Tax=[Candida] railenensis TaxID=45579 RepID=A0A9P0VYA8_9ASCO|nr:hypothetical protein CLIB1423_08S01266 [[Candida] railenensis]
MTQIYNESLLNDLSKRNEEGAPLQKLSSNSVPNYLRRRDMRTDNRKNESNNEQYELNSDLLKDVDNLQPVSDVSFTLFQTKLKIDAHKKHLHHQSNANANPKASEPIYYNPPSSIQSGIQSFLPPNYHGSTYNKFRPFGFGEQVIQDQAQDIRLDADSRKTEKASNPRLNTYAFVDKLDEQQLNLSKLDEELNDDDDGANTGPSGEWFNPVVKEALARQVNKENEFRKCFLNVALVIVFRLFMSFLVFLKSVYEESRVQAQKYQYTPSYVSKSSPNIPTSSSKIIPSSSFWLYGYLVKNGIYAFFIFNILLTFYRLLKTQDQCLDLQLSNKQREMLGLEAVHYQDDSEVAVDKRRQKQFETSKYSKTRPVPYESKLSGSIAKSSLLNQKPIDIPLAQDSSTSELTYSKPAHLQLSKKKAYDANEIDEISKKFRSRYNIDFHYSDEE